jgi:hypothetical protein
VQGEQHEQLPEPRPAGEQQRRPGALRHEPAGVRGEHHGAAREAIADDTAEEHEHE